LDLPLLFIFFSKPDEDLGACSFELLIYKYIYFVTFKFIMKQYIFFYIINI